MSSRCFARAYAACEDGGIAVKTKALGRGIASQVLILYLKAGDVGIKDLENAWNINKRTERKYKTKYNEGAN